MLECLKTMLEGCLVSILTDHVRGVSGIPAYRPCLSGVGYPCLQVMLEWSGVSLPTGHIGEYNRAVSGIPVYGSC